MGGERIEDLCRHEITQFVGGKRKKFLKADKKRKRLPKNKYFNLKQIIYFY